MNRSGGTGIVATTSVAVTGRTIVAVKAGLSRGGGAARCNDFLPERRPKRHVLYLRSVWWKHSTGACPTCLHYLICAPSKYLQIAEPSAHLLCYGCHVCEPA